MVVLCSQIIISRSKYDNIQARLCQNLPGHDGKHDEFPYLRDLAAQFPSVANKIRRDATMTTGAAWKSVEAGPNRILRWVMLLTDEELTPYGISMQNLKPQVVAKLREKAAAYEACMEVAKKLTWLVYQMKGAPTASEKVKSYLETYFGNIKEDSTRCLVCLESLSFDAFSRAMRGRAEIETGHMNPRYHNALNVGFAHRECNIAQGPKTLEEFYSWIGKIMERKKSI